MAGFWTIDPVTGVETHINGDPNMPYETLAVLSEVMRLGIEEQLKRKPEPAPEWGCPFDESWER